MPSFVEAVSETLFAPVQTLLDALRSGDPAKRYGFVDLRLLPKTAERMQQEAEPKKEHESAAQASDDPGPTGENDADATDEQIAEKIRSVQRTKAEMLAMARGILSDAGCDDTEIEKHLSEISDVFRDKMHEQKRKFFKDIEARLKARGVEFRRADDAAKDFDERKYEADDLRGLLRRGVDVGAKLCEAKIDGRRGLLLAA